MDFSEHITVSVCNVELHGMTMASSVYSSIAFQRQDTAASPACTEPSVSSKVD